VQQSLINRAEGEKQQLIKEAEGKAAGIRAVAIAAAEGIRAVAEAIQSPGSFEAVQFRVANDYILQFGNLAKETNTLILPSNMSDIAGMVATAMNVIRHGDIANGAGGPGPAVPPARNVTPVMPPKPDNNH
jgi:regulator of protease activity HflC (stomatin/prohibitin superfamily)